MTRTFLAVFLSLLYVVPVHARQAPPRAWVIATYAYPQRDRVAAIQPLADYLGLRARHPVQVRLFDSPTALVDALRRGEVDVAVPNLHGYLQARRASEPLTTLPVPQVPALQADCYRAVLVGRQGLEAPGELERQARTLRLVLVGRDSASGGFVPVRELRRRGLEPTTAFAHLAYAGSHAAALEAVASGRADVAALAADVYDASRPTGVVEVWRSQPIPPGPLLCRPAADVPCQQFTTWLLEAHDEAPAVMAALRAGWPEFGDAQRFTVPERALLDASTMQVEP
ncbi:PhnD/SsuA/transferrin family substrate-binding protein [Pseudoxanthomonas mexicana]|uniref:PhnD/SsuA/transferrin family substrate-binding protein n=1 Tax=Pseudoxanthomonas mexicana TaxID=128785 RepID=A0A7G9TFP0_PSEMX|nr:PhnD/SsuA/transferrin family substrate-binding protein [Pseudoxanthomonas mexicana]QNN78915.1 PhnD/SsuA/transferrin family substrate-binding protein [Pseudoxanthomonas mexicana]